MVWSLLYRQAPIAHRRCQRSHQARKNAASGKPKPPFQLSYPLQLTTFTVQILLERNLSLNRARSLWWYSHFSRRAAQVLKVVKVNLKGFGELHSLTGSEETENDTVKYCCANLAEVGLS